MLWSCLVCQAHNKLLLDVQVSLPNCRNWRDQIVRPIKHTEVKSRRKNLLRFPQDVQQRTWHVIGEENIPHWDCYQCSVSGLKTIWSHTGDPWKANPWLCVFKALWRWVTNSRAPQSDTSHKTTGACTGYHKKASKDTYLVNQILYDL